ncbi:MAG: hypothetical protein HY744_03365 [Deltaproteobacteria bacterium]|nr:hypothetical protein [Deltaproteobacteria bacterium]
MRPATVACAAAVLLGHAAAYGEAARPLAHGWSLYPLDGMISINGVACGGEQAALRTWHGDVAVFDGRSWTKLPRIPGHEQGRTYGTAIAMAPAGAEILIEVSGRIARWDGGDWSTIELPGWRGPIGAFAVLASGDLVVAGQGRIGLRSGSSVASYDAGTWRELSAVAGAAPGDLWTAGQGGTVMRHDARGWSRMATGTTAWVRGLFVTSPAAAWAWGGGAGPAGPLVLRWDGRVWAAAAHGLGAQIQGMAGDGARPWAVGDDFIARFDGAQWLVEVAASDIGSGYQAFRGICASSRFLFAGSAGHDGGALVRTLAGP